MDCLVGLKIMSFNRKTGMFHSNGPMPSSKFKLFNDDKSIYQLYNSVTGGTVKSFNACGLELQKKCLEMINFIECETKY